MEFLIKNKVIMVA